MYRVWFDGFIDRYYRSYEKAREACKRFIISQKEDKVLTGIMLEELDQFDVVEDLCGITEIKFEDEIEELAQTGKKKYRVFFTKYETIEVEADNENEAEELAIEILDGDAYAWEDPAYRITVELMEV